MSVHTGSDHFSARGGLKLERRWWLPERATRVVALVHGLAEHSARYDFVGRWLAARHFAVYAFDQRGHGRSAGPRTHCPDFDALLDDIESFLRTFEAELDGRPLVLLGHSMGGLEVARLLADRKPPVTAAVLSGPALGVADGAPRSRLVLARALSALLPRLPIPQPVDPDTLSRDPEVVAAYRADPLVPKRISARLAAELLRCAGEAVRAAEHVRVPVLIVHGEADALCPVAASRAFVGSLQTPAELKTYPGLRHEVLNEPEREEVLGDVVAWLDRYAPADRR